MTHTRYFTLLILWVLTTAFACHRKANDKKQEEANKEALNKTAVADIRGDWVVKSLQLTDKEAMLPKKYYTLHIDSESMGLPLDVNQCGTSYTVKGDSIVVNKSMTCTEACCDSETGKAVVAFLGGPLHYTIKEGILTLSHKKGSIQLFQPKDNLVGSRWEAVNYQTAGSEGKPIVFTNPYLLLFEPMNLIVKLDANNCFGKVSFSKQAFEVERGMGCSRKCCDSKDGVLLKDMLLGKNTYAINGDKMKVTTTDYEINFKRTEASLED